MDFFGFFGGMFLNFLGGFFWRNLLEEFFGRIFFLRNSLGGIFWEEFFLRNSMGGIFWEKFFGRNFLATLLKSVKLFEYESDWFVCQDFGF